jgi:hypothetical protein
VLILKWRSVDYIGGHPPIEGSARLTASADSGEHPQYPVNGRERVPRHALLAVNVPETLRESGSHRVELDEDTAEVHYAHRSWGTYRVIDVKTQQVVFASPNRDKAFGVFEYLTDQFRSSAMD